MLRNKTMLLTVVVVALAVPSLWAQKSVKEIKAELQKQAEELRVPVACSVTAGGLQPSGYISSTNKCSSSSPLYGFGNSLNTTVSTCSDKGGAEANYQKTGGGPLGLTVSQAAVDGSPFTFWGAAENVGGWEWAWPDIYSPAISPSPDIVLALKRAEGVVGLEVDDVTESDYTVTFATGAGNISGTALTGGVVASNPGAQTFVAICSGAPSITKITVHCKACSNAFTNIGQIRGDKFLGF
jgi:hypothetical protein